MGDLFAGIGINEALARGLGKAGITRPTGIQAEVIPLALFGKDVIGQSATGTGKTLAYLLPLLQKIETAKRETQAIVLAPTHELAMQIYHQSEALSQNAGLPVTAAPIIGQVNIARQIDMLKGKPHIIIGSSGRILELIQKRKINAQTIKTIIIDEADRLLDDMNWASVKAVIKTTMRDRQMLLFSATMTPAALERAKEVMRDPEVIAANGQTEIPSDISHMYFVCEPRVKFELLRKLAAHLNVEQALVFINQSEAIETTVMKLNYHGLTAAGIYGTAGKADRQKALEDFRSGKVRLLVASDLAARGLDIPGVKYVFNLELPEDPQIYLHRVGRTGRAGQSGTAISLVTGKEIELIAKLEKVLRIKLTSKDLLSGKVVDSRPPARPVKRSGTR
ncbi:DEAD/DEAH box helicase [Anaeroselena agilis]|uniref:DEAD/DEAH box helicase n=1 Tax=Anaeroselena agilis TaxID=3063788 RepID=A0ABU3P508_9FIRM|nr:DEAD/DEAH box helicase [Selenomonadales bacterium 4137-cl]